MLKTMQYEYKYQIRSLLAKCQQEAGLETRDAVQRLEKICIWRLMTLWKIFAKIFHNVITHNRGTNPVTIMSYGA